MTMAGADGFLAEIKVALVEVDAMQAKSVVDGEAQFFITASPSAEVVASHAPYPELSARIVHDTSSTDHVEEYRIVSGGEPSSEDGETSDASLAEECFVGNGADGEQGETSGMLGFEVQGSELEGTEGSQGLDVRALWLLRRGRHGRRERRPGRCGRKGLRRRGWRRQRW